MGRTRVAIVDEHLLFAECLAIALNARGYDGRIVSVPPDIQTPAALLSAIQRARSDVVVLSLELPVARNGHDLIGPIAATGKPVLVVTGSSDRARWGEALAHGARGVVARQSPLDAVPTAIRRINDQQPVLSREEMRELVAIYHRESSPERELRTRLGRLTLREGDVLGHLMAGRPVKDIARECVVSEATVRSQVKSILMKLEVSSQIAAVGVAHRTRWHPSRQDREGALEMRADGRNHGRGTTVSED